MTEFYLDNDVAVGLAERLTARGHGARTTRDLRLNRAPDGYQLLLASQNGWVFLTHNRNDFELLHDAWQRWARAWVVGSEHAGILILPHDGADANADRVVHFIEQHPSPGNRFFEWRGRAWTPWSPKGGMVP